MQYFYGEIKTEKGHKICVVMMNINSHLLLNSSYYFVCIYSLIIYKQHKYITCKDTMDMLYNSGYLLIFNELKFLPEWLVHWWVLCSIDWFTTIKQNDLTKQNFNHNHQETKYASIKEIDDAIKRCYNIKYT